MSHREWAYAAPQTYAVTSKMYVPVYPRMYVPVYSCVHVSVYSYPSLCISVCMCISKRFKLKQLPSAASLASMFTNSALDQLWPAGTHHSGHCVQAGGLDTIKSSLVGLASTASPRSTSQLDWHSTASPHSVPVRLAFNGVNALRRSYTLSASCRFAFTCTALAVELLLFFC